MTATLDHRVWTAGQWVAPCVSHVPPARHPPVTTGQALSLELRRGVAQRAPGPGCWQPTSAQHDQGG
jgi:hypothetical protein